MYNHDYKNDNSPIFVENKKCGGCINSIKTELLKLSDVTDVKIFKEENKVCVSGIAVEKEILVVKFYTLGYPEKGNNNFISKAKYYINCAMGK